MIVELTTSFLVGHATLRSSPFTSPRYSLGPIFSRLGAADGGRRFPPSDAGDLGLSVPCFAIMRLVCRFIATAGPSSDLGQVVVHCRAGGTRTRNRRFWRPVLYQLSYCPPADLVGAETARIAAAHVGSRGGSLHGRRLRATAPVRVPERDEHGRPHEPGEERRLTQHAQDRP